MNRAEQVVSGYRGPKKKVLIVDDVAENRAVVVNMFEQLGFEMFQAATGYDALNLAQAVLPDLILMDIVMPDIGGLEVIRRLRKTPACRVVPIIAVSASASAEVQDNAVAAGANAFVPKPIDLKVLMQRTASLLRLSWVDGALEAGGRSGRAVA